MLGPRSLFEQFPLGFVVTQPLPRFFRRARTWLLAAFLLTQTPPDVGGYQPKLSVVFCKVFANVSKISKRKSTEQTSHSTQIDCRSSYLAHRQRKLYGTKPAPESTKLIKRSIELLSTAPLKCHPRPILCARKTKQHFRRGNRPRSSEASKRKRRQTAKPLPTEIKQKMLEYQQV